MNTTFPMPVRVGTIYYVKLPNRIWKHTARRGRWLTTILYYVGPEALSRSEVQDRANTFPAFCEVSYDRENHNVMTVAWLNSNEKGLGTLLLVTAALEAMRSGISDIQLDDDSDNFGQPNNIYRRVGMKYIEDGFPEMVGSTRAVKERWCEIRKKYD